MFIQAVYFVCVHERSMPPLLLATVNVILHDVWIVHVTRLKSQVVSSFAWNLEGQVLKWGPSQMLIDAQFVVAFLEQFLLRFEFMLEPRFALAFHSVWI